MFSKLAIAFVSVAATANNACNIGTLQCCQSILAPQSAAAQSQLGPLDLVAGDITGFIGAQCNPISVLGAFGTGSNCDANPVCCEDNTFNGVVALGCTPVNINV